MTSNTAISVADLDFNDIKTSLKNFLSTYPDFLDYNFEGSIINLLLGVLSKNSYDYNFRSSMEVNEFFLDSALLRENVVSRAKELQYVPVSARGASTTLDVTITTTGTPGNITVAKNTQFTTTVDGEEFVFVTPQAYNLNSSNNTFTGTISIVEGRPLTHRFTVSTTNPVRYVLPNANIDTTSITVKVQNSSVDTASETYTLADNIERVTGNSTVFFLQEVENQHYEVYFGDGVIGKSPQNENIVVISYRVCEGTAGNDISTFTSPDSIAGYTTFTVSVNSPTAGGANAETINSIKFNAPKEYSAQNRAITVNDYKQIILRDNPDVQSLQVWGGEENTPPIYGTVYVSMKPNTGTSFSSERKDSIKTSLKKYNVLGIDVEFVDPTFLYVLTTTTVNYNSNLSVLSANEIQEKVLSAIETFETEKLGNFENTLFRHSSFVRAIDDSDTSIRSNLSTIKIQKRFVPSTTTVSTITLAFNNEIKSGITSTRFTYSGNEYSYLDDDGKGIVRIYYQLPGTTNKVYVNNTAGTVDYANGIMTINQFNPTGFDGSEVRVTVTPTIDDVSALRNQVLLIGSASVSMYDEATKTFRATTRTATTEGVSTITLEDGISTIVY